MSAPLPSSPRLRLVADAHSPVAARRLSAVLPLQADWARILGDVTTLGQLNVEATNTAARLRFAAEPWTAHLAGPSAWLCGPGINLFALTDRWGAANIAREPAGHRYEHLDVCDRLGQRLLRLSLSEESNWRRFGATVVSQWARRGMPARLPDRADLPDALRHLERHAAMALSGGLSDEWFDADRREYPGEPVDVSLLPPFFETLCDQACPLGIRLGNAGLLLEHDTGYFDCRQFGDTLRLRSTTATLELEIGNLAIARILNDPHRPDARWLRLYDERCRCVLVVGLGGSAEPADASLWQCMLRALRE